jgi:septal ring factor EnvC (AmiA/AmiB activator)
MSIQSEIVAEANLKSLAEWCRKINGDAWFAEESSALASIPTFSAEAFIAAASPVAVLALIGKHERAADDSHRNRQYFAEQVERCDKLKAENADLRAAITAIECRFEVSDDTLKVIRGCLRSAEGDIDRLREENDALRAQSREAK